MSENLKKVHDVEIVNNWPSSESIFWLVQFNYLGTG